MYGMPAGKNGTVWGKLSCFSYKNDGPKSEFFYVVASGLRVKKRRVFPKKGDDFSSCVRVIRVFTKK